MYDEYKVACAGFKLVNLSIYTKLYHELNIGIKEPKSDTCHACDKLKIKISTATGDEKLIHENALAEHYKIADEAYLSKSHDKETAAASDNMTVLTFDMQQCLPTPLLSINVKCGFSI